MSGKKVKAILVVSIVAALTVASQAVAFAGWCTPGGSGGC